ncbi:TetR/AcrR family transcriptional regulator [Actinoplanes sp. TFC3]|uniref:TetR/AcrR family transcriptional regulator n=1 Tax=Actinoplanes sp. TFC3 TaxID=1710355 RepID=UPI000A6991F3|nr:TetR/AcrR family transcriptional regulator [Actinoplanes sp. TFC3]
MRVAAERGLEAVSLRHVAAEAGVSAGMVQHYFRTKDEMMVFALDVVRERGQVRVSRAVAELGENPEPRALLRTVISAILPRDEESRGDAKVGLAFLAYTAVRPEAAESLRKDVEEMIRYVQTLVPVPGGAEGLLAMMEGLGLYVIGGYYSLDQALKVLDAHLDLLFNAGP